MGGGAVYHANRVAVEGNGGNGGWGCGQP
jgi:hypothetical protein